MHSLRLGFLSLAALGLAAGPPSARSAPPAAVATARPPPALTQAQRLEQHPCVSIGRLAPAFDGRCGRLRPVFLDLDEITARNPDVDRRGGTVLRYDFVEVTRPLTSDELATEDELSIAVRLILSEVGADRLLASRFALDEAVGILATVDHRLDPAYANPLELPEAPDFPGCGPDGTFVTCAEPSEYLGLQTWRALDPGRGYPADLLEPATDLAVTAWYLWREGLVADPTDGAVSYVHRCGGAAYGEPTWRCDGHMGRPQRDVPGANPHTGPIVFRSIAWWRENKGWYALATAAMVDYQGWDEPDLETLEGASLDDGVAFDGVAFDGVAFDGVAFDGVAFDGVDADERLGASPKVGSSPEVGASIHGPSATL